MTQHHDAVARAAATCPAELFHGPDGRAVRPCTPAEVTRRHLEMLAPQVGDNLLEIGVGSGYSGALLARLVGPAGHVTAIEYDRELAERAARLFAEHDVPVTVVTADGMPGLPEHAPYDRIFVGATPPAVPHAWLAQLRPGGRLLTGVRISDLPGSYAIAQLSVDDKHQPERVEVHHGGYTPMFAPPSADAFVRARQAGSQLVTTGDRPADRLLTVLVAGKHREPSPAPGDDYFHFKNWLLAISPDGLLEASLPEGTGIGIGGTSPNGAAHVALITGEHVISDAPDSSSGAALRSFVAEWRRQGAPRTHQLSARALRVGSCWTVRQSRMERR